MINKWHTIQCPNPNCHKSKPLKGCFFCHGGGKIQVLEGVHYEYMEKVRAEAKLNKAGGLKPQASGTYSGETGNH